MLITPNPIFILPVFQEISDVDVLIIQYKPFAAFYQWRDFLDLSPIMVGLTELDEAATEALATANAAALEAAAAQATADSALAAAAAAQATADDALAVAGSHTNGYTWSPRAFKTINGGFAGATFSSAVWLSTFWLMSGLNAEVSVEFTLPAGDYSISMLWVRGTATGDVTAYLDGVSLGGAAGYNATNLNAEWIWLAEDVESGLHTLNLKITGKQPASSGYNFALSQVSIRPNS